MIRFPHNRLPVYRVRTFTTLVALFFFCIYQAGAASYPKLTYLGIENGLSNNNVTSIYQDHYGFLWFGTYDGLNRYDGYNFKIFRNAIGDSGSLINNRINCIREGDQEHLWVGTGKGASIYNNTSYRFTQLRYLPYGQQQAQQVAFSVHSIQPDQQGHMYLATKKGLLRSQDAATPATQVPLIVDQKVYPDYEAVVVTCDALGSIWVIVRGIGLCLYNGEKQCLQLVLDKVKDNGNYLLADNAVLWIGANDGIYKYTIATRQFTEKKISARITHLSFARNHLLLAASDGEGVFSIDSTCSQVMPVLQEQDNASLLSTAVDAVYEDKAGRLWIASLQGGISISDPNKQLFTTVLRHSDNRSDRDANFINTFFEDKQQRIWIGTEGNGASVWDRKTNTYTDFRNDATQPSSLHSNVVIHIAGDADGNIWFAEWMRGLDKLNVATHRFEHYPCFNTVTGKEDKFVWMVYEDAQQQLWACTSNAGGLYVFNKKANRFDLFDNGLKDLLVLAEDQEKNLWAGDYGEDLIRIDKVSGKHQRFPIGYRVRTIHEDRNGHFWIGTEGGGLLLFDRKKGSYIRFTRANGLAGNSILSMLEDEEGCLWMGTYNGICKFDPATNTCKNYSISDGLQSNQFNYNTALQLRSGEFIFGGIRGFNLFSPAAIGAREKEKSPANIFLTGLKIDNIPIEANPSYVSRQQAGVIQELQIPYDKAVLSFDFVSLEYSAPDKVMYAYYMKGADRGWNEIDNSRSANFSQLHEGDYTFMVKATSTDGSWNPRQLSIHIIVLPPWYRTWLAYLLYLAMAAAGMYLYLRFLKKRNQLAYEVRLAQLETEKEKELNEKKLSFFTNISHEFRTPLTLIMNPVKEMLKNGDTGTDDTGLRTVYRNAKRLLRLVDQLLFFRKAGTENDTLTIAPVHFSGLCKEVFDYFTQQARTRKIDYRFHCAQDDIELYIDREQIEIALFNIVSNAIRFTPDAGQVVFEVQDQPEYVTVCIADSGPGIDAAAGNRIFEKFYQSKDRTAVQGGGFGIGLFLVKHFTDSHQGQAWYTSTPGEGTRFYIRLQKGKAHFGTQVQVKDAVADTSLSTVSLSDALDTPREAALPASTDLMPKASIQLSDKKTMLVIDDNEEIRSYIQQLFGKDMQVITSNNGITGLALCREHQPDIVISDVVMPGMDGITLCNHIKQDPDLNHIPVVLLTAVSSPDIKLQGVEEGADDYITKPFDKDLFIARINNILHSRTTLQHYYFDKITLKESQQKVSAEDKHFLDSCIALVEENLDNDEFNITVMTARIGMSRSNLYRKVKAISGSSINTFIRSIRLRKAAVLLLSTDLNVNQVAFHVGINDVKYFRAQFRKVFGMNPSDYVKKYRHVFNNEFQVVPTDN